MSQMHQYNILHITPHLGGGVGTVVLNYLKHSCLNDLDLRHSVLSLDSINDPAKQSLRESKVIFAESAYNNVDTVKNAIVNADIVLVHWWNHPLLADFLTRHTIPESRIIIWCHITGSPSPNNITAKIISYPDKFIFTTPVSYNTQEYTNLTATEKKKVSVIWSTAGVERLESIKLKSHEGFHVGYIGNLDPTKIHPEFINLCKSIKIPNVRFTVIGPANKQLLEKARENNMLDKIRFTGYISENEKWEQLSTFDVFGYPLARHHYGSCDQTIQESMAVGVPPVVLNNTMESFMVNHGVTGLVLNDERKYADAVEHLSKNEKLRITLGENAKVFARREYSISHSCNEWKRMFYEVLNYPKTEKSWQLPNASQLTPAEVFVESLGDYSGPFKSCLLSNKLDITIYEKAIIQMAKSSNWNSPNKSTVHQYYSFFPHDQYLKRWSALMSYNGESLLQ